MCSCSQQALQLEASRAENISTRMRVSLAAATCVHAGQRPSSSLPRVVALCARLSACLPDLWLCLAGLARPSQQLQLGANMLCLDTVALAQNRSRHGRSAQHLLAWIPRRCMGKKTFARQLCGLEFYIQYMNTVPFLYHLQQLLLSNIGSILRGLMQFVPEFSKLSVLHGQACVISLLTSTVRVDLLPSRQPWPRLLVFLGLRLGHQQ